VHTVYTTLFYRSFLIYAKNMRTCMLMVIPTSGHIA